jgi:hypothetical protein
MSKENIQLQKKLLMKLLKNKVLGSYHIRIETMLHGFSRHEIGDLKMAAEDLLRKGFLIWYNKSNKAIQLNKDKLDEIREFLME